MAEKKQGKRRGHHEGSVYYVESRERWVAEVTIETGKRKKFYFKTKQEAIKKKNEALREVEQGQLATGPQRKLGDYLEDWIENIHKDKLRIGSYVKYKGLIKHITEGLGDVWLQKLTPEQVRGFYTKLSREGLASGTINGVHAVLHEALENAVLWNYVSRNVCDLVKPPRIVSREATPLTLEQARMLLEHVRNHRLEVLLAMGIVTGMRRGELLALRWSNVNLEHRRLVVMHTVNYITGYGFVETEPKTKAGKRLINLPLFLVEMLKAHRVQQEEQRLKKGDKWQEHDLVFPNLRGGYLDPTHLLRLFDKLLKDAGLPDMHFHDLRHSAATILLGMGVNAKVIQQLLGHSNVRITLGLYAHLLPSMQDEAIDMWDGQFGSSKDDED